MDSSQVSHDLFDVWQVLIGGREGRQDIVPHGSGAQDFLFCPVDNVWSWPDAEFHLDGFESRAVFVYDINVPYSATLGICRIMIFKREESLAVKTSESLVEQTFVYRVDGKGGESSRSVGFVGGIEMGFEEVGRCCNG